MTGLLGRLVVAIVYGVIAWLVCLLLGTILVTLGVPVLTQIGDFLEKYGYLIGVLVGLLTFFGNATFPTFGNRA